MQKSNVISTKELLHEVQKLESLYRIFSKRLERGSLLRFSYNMDRNMEVLTLYLLNCILSPKENFVMAGYGGRGSGKTRKVVWIGEIVKRIAKTLDIWKGHELYTANLEVEGWPVVEYPDDLLDLRNCTIIIDEIHAWLNARRSQSNLDVIEMIHESRHLNINLLMVAQLPRTVDVLAIEHTDVMFYKGVPQFQIMEIQSHFGSMFYKDQINEIVRTLFNCPDKSLSFMMLNSSTESFAGWVRNPEPSVKITNEEGVRVIRSERELIMEFVDRIVDWCMSTGKASNKVSVPMIQAWAIENAINLPIDPAVLAHQVKARLDGNLMIMEEIGLTSDPLGTFNVPKRGTGRGVA